MRRTRSQAGSALIVAAIVVAMLIVLGMAALQTIGVDLLAAGAERSSDSALYTAEAGIHWALQELTMNYALDPAAPDFTPLFALSTVTSDATWGPPDLVGWHELHAPDVSKPYGTDEFRVAVCPSADPAPACAAGMFPPETKTILIRSLGISADGARRLLEVAVTF